MEAQLDVPVRRPSRLALTWRRLRRYPATLIGIAIVGFFLFLAVFGPADRALSLYTAKTDRAPKAAVQRARIRHRPVRPRCLLAACSSGARDVFVVAGTGTVIAVILGLTLGLFAGYFGSFLEEITMRLVDVLLAIPPLLLALLILGTLGPSRVNVIIVVGVLYIPMVARVVRSVVLDLKTRQFVEAAKMRGETSAYIMFKEVLPSVMPPLAVEASMRFAYAIFLVASLGFLGLGVQPPSPDWGLMVGEARNYFIQAPWVLLFPAAAIALLVVGIGFLSDGLRRMLLPGGVTG